MSRFLLDGQFSEYSCHPQLLHLINEGKVDQTIVNWLYTICPISEFIDFDFIGIEVLDAYCKVRADLSGNLNIFQKQRLSAIQQLFKLLEKTTVKPRSETVGQVIERGSYRKSLTAYPLHTTLLLIGHNIEKNAQSYWLWLLARLQTEFDGDLYQPCYLVDTLRQKKELSLIDTGVMLYGSKLDLFKACSESDDFRDLAHYFKQTAPRNRRKKSPFKGEIEFRESVRLPSGEAEIVTSANIDGYMQAQYLEIDAPTYNEKLSTAQKRSIFAKRKRGMSAGISRNNKSHPYRTDILTPLELKAWLNFHCPALLEGEFTQIDKDELPYWFALFLKMFAGKEVLKNKLFNENARKDIESESSIGLFYRIKPQFRAFLNYKAADFPGKTPVIKPKIYFSNKPSYSGELQWPLQSLLEEAIKSNKSMTRHQCSIYDALFSDKDLSFSDWLRNKIKISNEHFGFKVTESALLNAFPHFSKVNTPKITRDHLLCKSSPQAFYASIDKTLLGTSQPSAWIVFLMNSGFQKTLGNNSESSIITHRNETYHEYIGSAITPRDETIVALLKALVPPHICKKGSRSLNDVEGASQQITLYLHCRASMELALRSVNSTYPDWAHYAPSFGMFSVQDKRVAHRDLTERRFITLSGRLNKLIVSYQDWCDSFRDRTIHNSSVLTFLDGEEWCGLTRSNVAKLCERYLGSAFELGSFRHRAMHDALLSVLYKNENFDQMSLNLLMNHFQRGESPLGEFSIFSLEELASKQRDFIRHIQEHRWNQSVWSEIGEFDLQLLEALKQAGVRSSIEV